MPIWWTRSHLAGPLSPNGFSFNISLWPDAQNYTQQAGSHGSARRKHSAASGLGILAIGSIGWSKLFKLVLGPFSQARSGIFISIVPRSESRERSPSQTVDLGFNSTMFCYGAYDQVPAPCNRIGRVRVTHSSYNGQSLCYSSVTPSATAPLHLRYSSAPLRYTLRYSSVTPSVTAPLHPPLQLRYTSVTAPPRSATPSVTAP